MKNYMGMGLAVGIALGAGIGVALHNIAVGVSIGVCIGVATQRDEYRMHRIDQCQSLHTLAWGILSCSGDWKIESGSCVPGPSCPVAQNKTQHFPNLDPPFKSITSDSGKPQPQNC
jgi:hypothetical protein